MRNKLVIYCGLFIALVVLATLIFFGIKYFTKDSPEKVVEEMLEAFLEMDYDKFDSYIDYKGDGSEESEGFEEIVELLDYIAEEVLEYKDIEEVLNNGKRAKVTVKVTALDWVEVMEKLIDEVESNTDLLYYSEEKLDKYFEEFILELILDGDVDTVTNKITITLNKNSDGEWKVKDDDELTEVIFGNYEKAMKKYE